MSEIVVFDTSVLIDQIRINRHLDRMQELTGTIRNSAVVLAELWRGATTPVDRRSVETLERTHPAWPPAANDWWEPGQILAKIRKDKGYHPEKLRDLQFDVLIALTARS